MAAVRAELGTVLWEQLARRVGSETVVLAGPRAFRGTVVASYPEFLVLRAADGAEHLIRHGSAVSVALAPEPPSLRPTPAATTRRYQLALALRELARRREPIRVLGRVCNVSPITVASAGNSRSLGAAEPARRVEAEDVRRHLAQVGFQRTQALRPERARPVGP